MEAKDLTFVTEHGRLNYRVGAIIIHDGKLLMVKNKKSPYYYSVGGRVKLNETSEEAVVREVFEETGLHIEIDRLGFIHENFFVEEITKEVFHELSFFYYMKDVENINVLCSSLTYKGEEESIHWIPLQDIEKIHLYPRFFKTRLMASSQSIEHIITKEY